MMNEERREFDEEFLGFMKEYRESLVEQSREHLEELHCILEKSSGRTFGPWHPVNRIARYYGDQ